MKSILSKFQKPVYFFEVQEDWIVYSLETPQIEKLEKILVEKEDKIGIEFYKLTGIRPSEKEATGEVFKQLEAVEKAYFNQLNAVAQKTGISRSDIVSTLNGTTDISALIEAELEQILLDTVSKTGEDSEKLKAGLDIVETKQKIKQSRKDSKEETKENIRDLEIYLPELNEIYKSLLDIRNEYYLSLIQVFLNGDRSVANKKNPDNNPDFSLEDIKALHPNFQASLFTDFLNKEMGGWEAPKQEIKEEKEEKEEKKEELSKN